MRSLRRVLWASALSALSAGGAFAQTTGTGTTGSATTTGTGAGSTGSNSATNAAVQALQAPTIAAPSTLNTTTAALATSNAFNKYYANPYYQGRAGVSTGAASSSTANNPGGFGVALYGTGTGTSGTNSGAASTGGRNTSGGTGASTSGFGGTAGTTQARAGSTSGFGGTSGTGTTGGFGGATTGAAGGRQGQTGGLNGGANSSLNQQNNGLSTGRSIAYTATLKFAAPPVAAPQMLADLRTMIDTSASIADAKTVTVTTEAGGIVTLKGTARDEDEARLIEGMIRLTPGVKAVNNGLTFPKQ